MSLNTPSGSPKSRETGFSPMKTVMALATLVGLSVAGCAKPEASAAPAGATPIKVTTYRPDQGPAAGSAWVGQSGKAAGGDQFNAPGTFKNGKDLRLSLIDLSGAKILSDNDDNDLHGFMGGNAPEQINNPAPIVITGCCEQPKRGGGRPKPPPAPTPTPESCTDCKDPEKTQNDAMHKAGGGDAPPVAPTRRN